MFKLARDVYAQGKKLGMIEVEYDKRVTYKFINQETGVATELMILDVDSAKTLYELLVLAHSTHDGGQPY